MDSRSPETDTRLRIAITLIIMDKLLSLLPIASKARTAPLAPPAAPAPTRAEDIAIQQALDEVLEYHRTHRPKNTAKNYEPKQKEWKVSTSPVLGSLSLSLSIKGYLVNPLFIYRLGARS